MVVPEARTRPLNLAARPYRMRSSWQVYLRMYYKTDLKHTIDAMLAQFYADNPDVEKTNGPNPGYRNAMIKELYNAETDNIKAEVQRRCVVGDFSDEDIDTDNDDAVEAIEGWHRKKAQGYQRKVFLSFSFSRQTLTKVIF